jgi:hypothetical protein
MTSSAPTGSITAFNSFRMLEADLSTSALRVKYPAGGKATPAKSAILGRTHRITESRGTNVEFKSPP